MLQNSKEEALNQAFKGEQHVGENNIVQELTKAILVEVKRMTGNDVCCDCGAPSEMKIMMLIELVLASVTTVSSFFFSPSKTQRGCPPTWAFSPASSVQGSTGSWESTTPGSSL